MSRAETPSAGASVPPWLEEPLAALLAGAVPQALIVQGPAGVGKSALASAYAQALLCEARRPGARACGQCAACRWFAQGSHPDFRHVVPDAVRDAAEDEGADGAGEADAADAGAGTESGRGKKASREIRKAQIDALAEFVAVGSHRRGRRVALIEPADALNAVASNALLKTLEEPPAGASFVLVTARPARLLPTIRSRCRVLALALPPHEAALAWLQAQVDLDAEPAQALLAAAGGGPLAALRLSDDASAAAHRTLLDAIARLPDTGLSEAADAVEGVDAAELVTALQRWLVDVARVGAGASPLYHPARAARLAQLAARASAGSLADAAQALARQRSLAEHPLNARLFVEETLDGYTRAFGPAPRRRQEHR